MYMEGKINRRKFEFSYNSEEDDLFLFRAGAKSAGAVEMGPIVLDMDRSGKIIAIEFMNAREYLASSTGIPTARMGEILNSLSGCEVDTKSWRNSLLLVRLVLLSGEKEVTWNFSVPRMHEASPVSSCAGS